jgi:ketosteroid isomerase-like protein
MKPFFSAFITMLLFFASSCSTKPVDSEKSKVEILQAEKDFAQMVKEKGIATAFYAYADTNAVIRRGNQLIKGKASIKDYFRLHRQNGKLQWSPDFVEASGDLGYTYGPFVFSEKDSTGKVSETKGYFHTVWKRQKDKTWKFVWD